MVVNQTSSSHNLQSDRDLSQVNLDRWLTSVTSILDKITTLEVNTTIVSEIREEVFLPWEAYQDIYAISRTYLQEVQIPPALCDRYLNLRRQLELKYALRAINPNCQLYNSAARDAIRKDLTILSRSNDSSWENLPSRLPSPFAPENTAENKLLGQILIDTSLLKVLRQLARSKANLDQRHQITQETDTTSITNQDITYAQTIIELEGKITNCYAQEILHHPDKEAILILHQQGVQSGEKQWYRLLKFAINIVQRQQKVRKS
ncbi:MAG: hypothetical protein QNJ65_00115 [Xenococcaceae cyanobacterium MO_234.B1]|nr:hypothetical protein [Xenococcaceae cyanobacterium MO_234.B1]